MDVGPGSADDHQAFSGPLPNGQTFGLLLSDSEIRARLQGGGLIVSPFAEECLTPNGLDLRIGSEAAFILPGPAYASRRVILQGRLEVPANSVLLLLTMEEIVMPDDLVAQVNLRSTFARRGFLIPSTVVDAGYRGRLTLQVHTPPYPTTLKKGERFWHLLFHEVRPVGRRYSGKYQNSRGLVEAP